MKPSKENLEIARRYWRKWVSRHLYRDRHNYDFSEMIPWKKAGSIVEIEDAWRIELDRELGLICEPFLTTWEKTSLSDIPEPKKLKGLRELFSAKEYCQFSRHHEVKKTVMLEIDTSFSILEIVESFKYWLENHGYPQTAQNNFGVKKGGRPPVEFPGWFLELAIYRCDNAGLPYKFGKDELLTDFLKNLASAPGPNGNQQHTGKISESYWSHAKTRTRTRIFHRMIQLMECEALSRGTRAKPDINAPWQKWLGRLR